MKLFLIVIVYSIVAYCTVQAKHVNKVRKMTKSGTVQNLVHERQTVARVLMTRSSRRGRTRSWWWWGGANPDQNSNPQSAAPSPAPAPDSGRKMVEVPPVSCKVERLVGSKYTGKHVVGVARKIKTEQECVALCHELQTKGTDCGSINYFSSQEKCELRSGIMEDDSQRVDDDTCVYVHALSCTRPTKPAPQPTPTPTPQQTPSHNGKCGITYNPPEIDLSPAKRKTNRIVGGKEAKAHSLPWLVSLQQGSQHFCDGSLIRVHPDIDKTDIVLTAAHCVFENPVHLKIVAGAHRLNSFLEDHESVTVLKWKYHEHYDHKLTINDLALLKLSTPVTFSKTKQPACIPEQDEPVPAEEVAIVAGWGTLHENVVELPGVLMQVPVPVVQDHICKQWYPNDFVGKDMFCAGWRDGGRDSCQGDSGGPLNFKTPQGWWEVKGIVSFGDGCARAKKPGVYTRLAHYRKWIDEKVAEMTSIKS